MEADFKIIAKDLKEFEAIDKAVRNLPNGLQRRIETAEIKISIIICQCKDSIAERLTLPVLRGASEVKINDTEALMYSDGFTFVFPKKPMDNIDIVLIG